MLHRGRRAYCAVLLTLALFASGCGPTRSDAQVQPLIDQILAKSGATHVGFISLATSGSVQLSVWDGQQVTTWDASVDQEPTSGGHSPVDVPSAFAPVAGFDWAGLYDKAKQRGAEDKQCLSAGVVWRTWPNGKQQQHLECGNGYVEGSTTVDGIGYPDSLDTNTAQGLDEAFRLVEQLVPEGLYRVDWNTPVTTEASVKFTSAASYVNTAGEPCAMSFTLGNLSSPLASTVGPSAPAAAICTTWPFPVESQTGADATPATVAFQPSSFGGAALLAAYQQAIAQAKYPAESYTLAEVWGLPDGSLNFQTWAGTVTEPDVINIALPS